MRIKLGMSVSVPGGVGLPGHTGFTLSENGNTHLSQKTGLLRPYPKPYLLRKQDKNAGACFARGAPSFKENNAKETENGDPDTEVRSGATGRELRFPKYSSPKRALLRSTVPSHYC